MAYVLQKSEEKVKLAFDTNRRAMDWAIINNEFILEIDHAEARELLTALKDRFPEES